MILACGHAQKASEIRLCSHLIGQNDVPFWRVLRGEAMRYDCCCELCQKAFQNGEKLEFFEVCDHCARQIDDKKWELRGWLGTPEIREELATFNYSLQTVVFAPELANSTAAIPLDEKRVLALCGDEICLFEGESFSTLGKIEIPADKDKNWGKRHLTPRFHLSPSGRFAALVNDFGRYGAIWDLETARQTMNLNRGEYHPETQFFPLAFFQNQGRDLVVHASDWNRLEISDPQDGALLTPRDAMKYEDKNPHYLNYFHGALHVSPDFEWILDDGWVWQPMGLAEVWNLKNWLESNVYESEDGASKRTLDWNEYWNKPIFWLDSGRVAIEGFGDDDQIRGATIWDVASGEVLNQFAGPSGTFWSDGARLFSVESDGLHLWNVEKGARTGILSGFAPQFQIGRALAQIEGNAMRIWDFG